MSFILPFEVTEVGLFVVCLVEIIVDIIMELEDVDIFSGSAVEKSISDYNNLYEKMSGLLIVVDHFLSCSLLNSKIGTPKIPLWISVFICIRG